MKSQFIGLFFIFLITGCAKVSVDNNGNETLGNYDSFAKCLFDNDAVMYGTDWCSHCQNQKAEFGRSFKYVNFVDCDAQKEVCLRNNIKGYPTWVIDGKEYPGEQRLERLAGLTGCKLPEISVTEG